MADELLDPARAVDHFVERLNEEISNRIRLLLEEKHLYQKVKIDRVEELRAETLRRVPKEAREWVVSNLEKQLRHLTLTSGGTPTRVSMEGGPRSVLCLNLPIVRLFCHTCKRKEAFAPLWYQDATNELLKPHRGEDKVELNFDIINIRLYFIAYQCQYCEGAPEGFLVRKAGWMFSLDGRSPMEHIELPRHIPEQESHLFRDAIIAWHAGKWLAAVFYLRCFIEQFARRQTGTLKERKTGDEIMDAYAQVLPLDKRSHLPSLKQWYDRLSEPMHIADEDAAEKMFDEARQEIEHHFELRHAFRIPEK